MCLYTQSKVLKYKNVSTYGKILCMICISKICNTSILKNQCSNIKIVFLIGKNIKSCTYWAVSLVIHGKKKT